LAEPLKKNEYGKYMMRLAEQVLIDKNLVGAKS
jgi:glucose-1-phosphate thymidylyltransferase